MKDVDRERLWWNERAATPEGARDAIASDPAAWDGAVLEASLERILPAIRSALLPGRVLDLGCGAGRLTIPIAERLYAEGMGAEVMLIGLDVSQAMLDLALRWDVARVGEGKRHAPIIWQLGDGRTIPWQVGSLVAAYSMITLQHIPRDAQAGYIRAVAERLIPLGVFRFQVLKGMPNEAGWLDDVFLWHCVDEAWVDKTCRDAGLEVKELSVERPLNDDDSVSAIWVTAVKR